MRRVSDFATEENKARLDAARAALEWLDAHAGAEDDDEATESARALYAARVRRLQTGSADDAEGAGEMEQYRSLRLTLLGVERAAVLELRRDGRINATLLRTIERDFDLEQARLTGS
ncbi:hypothetical protein [Candidatus Mycobacterium methanotrophicum]|uniref:Na+/H+ antiporter n=1 Tax=Candidatus Mycobacterium methanotrophicum TaxID=2943498 RepID=A0ABY4QHR4_9MYCO|nr:hypothetical protein [Candidatus Mycobacterium methanotrophicum]UQX09757.1 hypothetical protein M5I08_15765 [Candidatus Mycobacterium methanotrophicum]